MEIKDRIIEAYMNRLREHGSPPESVFVLCKDLGIVEREFFTEFPSLECVESRFWGSLVRSTVDSIRAGQEFGDFSAQQQMLTFFFAFLEKSLECRSLLLLRFKGLSPTCRPPFLEDFETEFRNFAADVFKKGRESGEIANRGRLGSFYPAAFYQLFRAIVDFNIRDASKGYERSDAYIEKSVKLAFDLVRNQAIDSAFDLVRFLIPSRLKSGSSGGSNP